MKNLIIISIAFGAVLADKVYIPDEENVIGISSKWYNPKACYGPAWSGQTDVVTNIFYWAVCFSVNCLLETTTYKIKSVNTVFADITYGGRYCRNNGRFPTGCVESISVNAVMADTISSGSATETAIDFPGKNDKRIPENNFPSFYRSQGTFQFDNTQDRKYMRYIFNSTFTCGTLRNFTVYYFKCPTVTESLAEFGDFNAPNKIVGEELHEGKCVKHSVKIGNEKLTMTCKWNGSVETNGKCQCNAGYEKNGMQCTGSVTIDA